MPGCSNVPGRPRRAWPLLAVLVVLLTTGQRAARGGPDEELKALRERVTQALEEKDAALRAKAFESFAATTDPRALAVLLEALRKADELVRRVRDEQVKAEQAYERAINEMNALEGKFRERNDGSAKATESYNRRMKKLEKEQATALESLRRLENEFLRAAALPASAVAAAGRLVGRLPPAAQPAALDQLDRAWLRSPEPRDAERFVDALGGIESPLARERLRAAMGEQGLAPRARAAALLSLAGARDGTLPAAAVGYLTLGVDQFPLLAASIRALRLLHVREAIEPLITLLGRQDLGRLRNDAHDALRSLTGQAHGPYLDPWLRWWKEAAATFALPPAPAAHVPTETAEKGVTFYGITTFSERILFVLDVSGSMDKPAQADRAEPDRLSVAKKELLGAIFNVGDGQRFNVMLFNHEVLPWQASMVVASEDQRRRAKQWVEGLQPVGGTNIHDALEAAFREALKATGEPLVDTIFFLTDGTPTAGRIQDPARILEQVVEWNRAAQLTLHCVAVGEADVVFLKGLAQACGGQFIHR